MLSSGSHDDETEPSDDEPLEVSLEFTWEEIASISADITPTIEEFLKFTGPAANYVSSDQDDECANIKSVDILITHNPECSNKQSEIVRLDKFRYEQLVHDYSGQSIACTGKCNITDAVVTRAS